MSKEKSASIHFAASHIRERTAKNIVIPRFESIFKRGLKNTTGGSLQNV